MLSNSSEIYKAYLIEINKIDVYFNIISSSIGIPCHIISIIIFARLMRNKNNMGYLYIWQCSVDLLVLLYFLFIVRSKITFNGINLYDQNEVSCKLLNLLRRFVLQSSSWIAVITTFDRFTFVLYGHCNRFKFLKSKLNLTYIILATFFTITILNSPNFFYYISKNECKADFIIKFLSDFISVFFLRTYIPFALMLIFNIIMIRKKYKTNRHVLNHQNSAISRKEAQFTFAVITYDAYFLILISPLSVFFIFYDVNFYTGSIESKDLFSAKYILVHVITTDISLCEQTFSFFMYFAFNRLFRNELLSMIKRIFHIQ